MKYTAHEIASEPDLYNLVYKIGKYKMECFGYSRTGYTVRFGDVVPVENGKVRLVIRYIDPNELIEVAENEQSA